jgi:hypothetical protein
VGAEESAQGVVERVAMDKDNAVTAAGFVIDKCHPREPSRTALGRQLLPGPREEVKY